MASSAEVPGSNRLGHREYGCGETVPFFVGEKMVILEMGCFDTFWCIIFCSYALL